MRKNENIDNNLYIQIGLALMIALSAKNATLRSRELRSRGETIVGAAVNPAPARFRPILTASAAFVLAVVPLVLATGVGASVRKLIGIAMFNGTPACTCLAPRFVLPFFVVVKRFEGMAGGYSQVAGRPGGRMSMLGPISSTQGEAGDDSKPDSDKIASRRAAPPCRRGLRQQMGPP